ncbi:MAG: CSLREA domain-containing protein [Chloroflexi bacterium]|nr:CSLREA domain-containing protein [Chloroflexota bacterium]
MSFAECFVKLNLALTIWMATHLHPRKEPSYYQRNVFMKTKTYHNFFTFFLATFLILIASVIVGRAAEPSVALSSATNAVSDYKTEISTPNQIITFTVTKTTDTNDGMCDADCSLREAIIAANTSPGDDTIVLPAGTYVFAIPGTDEDAAATGDLDVTENLTITGAGTADTVIDGGGLDRVFDARANLTMSGVNIQNGMGDQWSGAGIFQWGGTLTLDHVEVRNNMGAGIWIETLAGLKLSNALLQENANPNGPGGGLIIAAGLCTGCIRTIELTNVAVISNTAAYGGGINIGYSKVSLDNVTIAGNSAVYDGGGLHNHGGVTTMTHSIVTNNIAGEDGGGISNRISDSSLTIINSTISGNTAQRGGGLSSKASGHTEFFNTTIAQNNASEIGGGVGILDSNTITDGGFITFTHSILAVNTSASSPNCGIVAGGEFASEGYNLLGSNQGCTFSATTGDMVNIDPQLGPLQDNGGPTPTHALQPGSPATDAGNPAGCIDSQGNLLLTDQRGFSRPQDGNNDGNTVCDIGAYEYRQSSMTLNHPNGAPGSYFIASGTGFPSNDTVTLTLNGTSLGTVSTDDNGAFELILTTDNADEGYYILTARADTSATVPFTLDAALPTHPQEGSGTVFDVPAGIAYTKQIFLPVVSR